MRLFCNGERTLDCLARSLLTVPTTVRQLIFTVDCRNVVLDIVNCPRDNHLPNYYVDSICQNEMTLSSVIFLFCSDSAIVADLTKPFDTRCC